MGSGMIPRMGTKTRLPTYMTADEFLAWNSGDETHYELVDGELLAMTSPLEEHGTVVANFARVAGNQLRPPCRVVVSGAIRYSLRDDTVFEADAAVTCAPPESGRRALLDPVVILEVASPSTERYDIEQKLARYRDLPSVRDIVFVYIRERRVAHYARQGDGFLVLDIIGQGMVRLASFPVVFPLAELFANMPAPEAPAAKPKRATKKR